MTKSYNREPTPLVEDRPEALPPKRIYMIEDGTYVVADQTGWLPGTFLTKAAAREAACTATYSVQGHRQDLIYALNALPWTKSAPPLYMSITDGDEAKFLVELMKWVNEFDIVLKEVIDANTDMSSELTQLRRQRDAVRDFFGTATQ